MTDILGYERYAASGGDWGALIASQLGHKYKGGHYGYYENPEAVIHDIRETFKDLR